MQISGSLELAASGAEARSMFNAATFQLMGDEVADTGHCDEIDIIDDTCSIIMAHVRLVAPVTTHGAHDNENVYKAAQTTVQVKTPLGMQEERVPATCKQIREHPRRLHLQWEMATRKARDVLLNAGNVMVLSLIHI